MKVNYDVSERPASNYKVIIHDIVAALVSDSEVPSIHNQKSLADDQVSMMTMDEDHNVVDIFGRKQAN